MANYASATLGLRLSRRRKIFLEDFKSQHTVPYSFRGGVHATIADFYEISHIEKQTLVRAEHVIEELFKGTYVTIDRFKEAQQHLTRIEQETGHKIVFQKRAYGWNACIAASLKPEYMITSNTVKRKVAP